MTTETKARCSIYEDRPKGCQEYPKVDSYHPEECTYYFIDGERMGACECGVGACCALPRDNGGSEAKHLPVIAGGKPCKHLEWVEPKTKTASLILHSMNRNEAIEAATCVDKG